jgi:predicted molibdopterin-dependent oxidoreductase YjgC
MFKKITADQHVESFKSIDIVIDGNAFSVPADVTVAAAVLMATNTLSYRQHLAGEPRAPYCMMGVCHECLIEIDGVENQQGCLVNVKPGMHIQRQGQHHE